MKTLIVAPKGYTDFLKMTQVINASPMKPKTAVLSTGDTPSAMMWERWAGENKLEIDREDAPNWRADGKLAEVKRNNRILERAEGCIAIWDNKDAKIRRMIEQALKNGVKTDIYYLKIPAAEAIAAL